VDTAGQDIEAFLYMNLTAGEGTKMRERVQIYLVFMTMVPQGDKVLSIK
jgi:hypothetical protein